MCCGFCTSEEAREARLVKRVKNAMGPAIELEKRMAKAGDMHAQVGAGIVVIFVKPDA